MAFLTEPEPLRGVATPVHRGISRIVAPNPGKMTYHGTNTYLIEGPDGLSVLDPGPDDASHVQAILTAGAGRIRRILLSHTHADHLGAVAALRSATGALTHAFARSATPDFTADHALQDGDSVAGWTAIHTPGHAADHICLANSDGVLFSADQVMSWSSSVVSPPGGDMGDYIASLTRLLTRPTDTLYLPGHGPPLPNPHPFVTDLLHHRQAREAAILTALTQGPTTTATLVDTLYSQLDPTLRRAAERNVIAHLHKLRAEGRACEEGVVWRGV